MAVPGKVVVYPDAQEFFILSIFYTVDIQVKIQGWLIHMLQFLSCDNEELFFPLGTIGFDVNHLLTLFRLFCRLC